MYYLFIYCFIFNKPTLTVAAQMQPQKTVDLSVLKIKHRLCKEPTNNTCAERKMRKKLGTKILEKKSEIEQECFCVRVCVKWVRMQDFKYVLFLSGCDWVRHQWRLSERRCGVVTSSSLQGCCTICPAGTDHSRLLVAASHATPETWQERLLSWCCPVTVSILPLCKSLLNLIFLFLPL